MPFCSSCCIATASGDAAGRCGAAGDVGGEPGEKWAAAAPSAASPPPDLVLALGSGLAGLAGGSRRADPRSRDQRESFESAGATGCEAEAVLLPGETLPASESLALWPSAAAAFSLLVRRPKETMEATLRMDIGSESAGATGCEAEAVLLPGEAMPASESLALWPSAVAVFSLFVRRPKETTEATLRMAVWLI